MKRKILIGALFLISFLIVFAFISSIYNRSLEAPELTTNFVDINKVKAISRYRSCSGHAVVPQDKSELKRSMKHYVGIYPQYRKENTVEIYAPYDGTISIIMPGGGERLEGEFWLAQDRGKLSWLLPFGLWMVSFEHVKLRPDLGYGDRVKAGELIGYAPFYKNTEGDPTFDVVYAKVGIPPKRIENATSPFAKLDSVFNHMSDKVLAEYRQRGVTRDNIIITKEMRDSNPCKYIGDDPYFEGDGGLPNSVTL